MIISYEMKKHPIEMMMSESCIQDKVKKLGEDISSHYSKVGGELILIGLLRGSFIFIADLCREITYSHEIDFMTVSSYGNSMNTSRDVRVLKDLDEDIQGKHVLIVEDIVDTGYTLSKVKEMLEIRKPASLEICTLLDKPERREVKVRIKWVGFCIPDEFIVGYGIDYAQRYRYLPYLGKVKLLET